MPVEEIRRLRPVHQYVKLDADGNLLRDSNGVVISVIEDFDDNDVINTDHISIRSSDNLLETTGDGELFVDSTNLPTFN